MTDQALSLPAQQAATRRVNHASAEAVARLKKRYRSEARFKALGLLAIAVTAAFLALLLFDILRKGIPAFFEHRAVMNVQLDPAVIDPKGARDPQDLRSADYQALVRQALQRVFPQQLDRRTRRMLDSMLSSGAADDLRARVMADPNVIGRSVAAPLLLSSDADLFLRERERVIERRPGEGTLQMGLSGADVTFRGQSPSLVRALGEIKGLLATRLRAAETELSTLTAGASTAVDQRRALLQENIADLKRRMANPNSPEALSTTEPSFIVAIGGGYVKLTEIATDGAKGQALVSPQGNAAQWSLLRLNTPESNRRVQDQTVAWLDMLATRGMIENGFAWRFFTNGDSREPELAGIRGALIGSALTLLVTLALCLPIGVAAAIYLEEFAPKNRFTDLLEVNINNLAAVPSIVFGLLGLAMFLNTFNLPRSAPLVGGLVLALLVLPTIIIASRATLRAVPPSIKEAALGLGASHQQAIFHHVLPLAMPGIMTGTIIGMAHALGETAPLLMIGMVAFIVDIPKAITDASTVLPVQIFLWSDLPELAFQSRTAAAIIVLLVFLLVMNAFAIILRKMFERRW